MPQGARRLSVARMLVGCETSGVVRRAFAAQGIEAWSCDLLPSEDGDPRHVVGDVRHVVAENGPWDLLIGHPPCTSLARSGARWWPGREAEQRDALNLVRWLLVFQRHVMRVCVENPIGLVGTRIRPAEQIIQPWHHGHGETKATCLWLRQLPLLRKSAVVTGREARVHRMGPSADRWRLRSRTYEGVAAAMARQWAPLL